MSFPSSKIKAKLAGIMLDKKMISGFSVEENGNKKMLNIALKYHKNEKGESVSQIQGLKRVSRQGQRIYVRKSDIVPVKSGY